MQDKIPDALIAAFERHYSLDWNDPAMRNERLAWRAAWAEATKPCLHHIQEPAAAEQAAWHAGLDEGRAQAAPEAVAVPDAMRDAEKLLRAEAARLKRIYSGHGNKWYGFSNEKAAHIEHLRVADALAATPAAAPVVLPEPEAAVREVMELIGQFGLLVMQEDSTASIKHTEVIKAKLRALLAGVSAPAAQVVEKSDTFGMNIGQRILHVGGRENAQTYIEFGSVAAVRALVHQVLRELPDGAPGFAIPAPQAQADARDAEITWPKARDVGRFDDMSPGDSIRVGLDSDNDVYVSVCGGGGVSSVEFCNPGGGGGGKSSRTRLALLALMVAMEADNADDPARDWWARRNTKAAQGGEHHG